MKKNLLSVQKNELILQKKRSCCTKKAPKPCSSAAGEDRRSLQSFEDLERKRTAEVRFVSCVAPEKNKKNFCHKIVALIVEK